MKQSFSSVAADSLVSVRPHYFATKSAAMVFFGYLNNVTELADRLQSGSFSDLGTLSRNLQIQAFPDA